MSISLRIVTLLNASAAAPGSAHAIDYRYDGTQNRTVFVTMNASDTINIEASPDATNWFTVATTTGATSAVLTIVGPYPYLRANKTGTAGSALVVGVI